MKALGGGAGSGGGGVRRRPARRAVTRRRVAWCLWRRWFAAAAGGAAAVGGWIVLGRASGDDTLGDGGGRWRATAALEASFGRRADGAQGGGDLVVQPN